MKKLMLLAICMMAMIISCKNKNKTATTTDSKDTLTAVIDSIIEENDTTPMPMFLANRDKEYMQMIYWSELEEPQKTEDNAEYYDNQYQAWALQEIFRRNAAQYTNLLANDKIVKIKFVDEVLKDPDGNTPSIGEVHGRPEIPALCARFDVADPKDNDYKENGFVIVTNSYLKSRQRLKINHFEYEYNKEKPLPENVITQLEQKYGMEVSRSVLKATIDTKYTWGILQFKGEYKNAPKDKYNPDAKSALALDVLIENDKIYTNEVLGYYIEGEGPTWNADDGGIYLGCDICEAFEGPKGLEMCFRRYAPESMTAGMFYLRNGQLIQHEYATYHVLIDEVVPVWKKDIEEMRKLYLADDPHVHKNVKLSKWARCFVEYTNEWIWLRDKDDQNGALFIREDGKFKLIAVETPQLKPARADAGGISYLRISGSAGGPSMFYQIWAFKGGKLIEEAAILEILGEVSEFTLNGKSLSKDEGKAYLSKVTDWKALNASFQEIETEE